MQKQCPLCQDPGCRLFYNGGLHIFYECNTCGGLFRPRETYPDAVAEKERYLTHNNDVNDPAYQKFVSPIVNAVLAEFTAGHTGLDFGSGTGPVISKMLLDAGYNVKQYDPFFANFPQVLDSRYNYIACCEVMEHFYSPDTEFRRLRELLLPGGRLYCMTDLYNNTIDFDRWYYKNDPTHVFIYREATIHWIAAAMGFAGAGINKRLIIFTV